MAVKHWNTGSSAERYRRENEQASKQKNKFKKMWERASKEKRGSVSVPIAKQGSL